MPKREWMRPYAPNGFYNGDTLEEILKRDCQINAPLAKAIVASRDASAFDSNADAVERVEGLTDKLMQQIEAQDIDLAATPMTLDPALQPAAISRAPAAAQPSMFAGWAAASADGSANDDDAEVQ